MSKRGIWFIANIQLLKKMEEQDSIYDITVKKVSDLENELERMERALHEARKKKN